MGTLKDAFESLTQVYQEGVAKADEAGYAELFKAATEQLVKIAADAHYTITDLEYLDGYYIFGMGTNSVVHFHIKECPEWKFGVWWERPDKDGKPTYVTGSCFAQFEPLIDKFKPSASTMTAQLYISKDYVSSWDFMRLLNFIHNEPALAFCRDYLSWDYNAEYHSRESAEEELQEWRRKEALKQEGTRQYCHTALQLAAKLVQPHLKVGEELYAHYYSYMSPCYGLLIYKPDLGTNDTNDELEFYEEWDLNKQPLQDLQQEYEDKGIYIDTWVLHPYARYINVQPPVDNDTIKLI